MLKEIVGGGVVFIEDRVGKQRKVLERTRKRRIGSLALLILLQWFQKFVEIS